MMEGLLGRMGDALLMAFGMFWVVGWSLVLGFVLSGLIQALVSQQRMRELLGKDGLREIVLAIGFGAASSSCSYASADLAVEPTKSANFSVSRGALKRIGLVLPNAIVERVNDWLDQADARIGAQPTLGCGQGANLP